MTGYDVTRLMPAGLEVIHHDGALTIDGPWLVLSSGPADATPERIIPSHAVVSVDRCGDAVTGCRARRKGVQGNG